MWKLNQFQAIMLTSSSYMPLTYYFFAGTAVEYSGYYALWTIFSMILIGLLLGWLHQQLNKCFPGLTGADYHIVAFGRFIGKAVAAAYLPVYLTFVGLSIHYYLMTMKPFFPLTPVSALGSAMITVALLGAVRGLEALGRAASIISSLTLLGNLLTMVFIIFSGEHSPHVVYALPPVTPLLNGIYHLFPMYLGFNLVNMLNPYVDKQWYPVLGPAVNSIMLLGNFIMSIHVLGYGAITHLQYPFTYVIQLLRLTGFIIERLGITVVIVATAFTCSFVANHLWCLSVLTSRIFGRPDSEYRKYVIFLAIPMLLVAIIADEELDHIILNSFLVPASWITLVVLPLLSLVTSKLKHLPHRIDRYKKRYFPTEPN